MEQSNPHLRHMSPTSMNNPPHMGHVIVQSSSSPPSNMPPHQSIVMSNSHQKPHHKAPSQPPSTSHLSQHVPGAHYSNTSQGGPNSGNNGPTPPQRASVIESNQPMIIECT